MSGNNRHLRGDVNAIKMPVHGATVVEPGDLLVYGGDTNIWTAHSDSRADYYAYPVSGITGSAGMGGTGTLCIAKNHFCGIALSGSKSGTTEDITVALTGTFRYPLRNIPGKDGSKTCGTTVGLKVSMVTPASVTVAGPSDQAVCIATHSGTSAYIGYCIMNSSGGGTKGGTSYVDFVLKSKWGLGLAT